MWRSGCGALAALRMLGGRAWSNLRVGLREVAPDPWIRTVWWLKSGGPAFAFRALPVARAKVVGCSFYGSGYGGGCRYVFDELLAAAPGLDLVWLRRAGYPPEEMPSQVRVVRYGSLKSLFELATARVWLDDSRKKFSPSKRRSQFYVQLWHGPFGIKQVERDAVDYLSDSYAHFARRDGQWSDVMVSGSRWFTALIERSFWFNGEVMHAGSPRVDPLLRADSMRMEAIKRALGVHDATQVLLYVPTFRDGTFAYASEASLARLAAAAALRWGGDWTVLARLHPNVAGQSQFTGAVMDVSLHPDLQELIVIADLVVTDYSSVVYDAMVASVRCILFVPDIVEYATGRPLYFHPTELPFEYAETIEGLVERIHGFDEMQNRERVRRFLDTLGACEDGRASQRVAERIIAEILSD